MNRILIIGLLLLGFTSCYISYTPRVNRPPRSGKPPRNNNSTPAAISNPEKLTARVKLFHVTSDTCRVYFILDARSQDYFLLNDKSKYRAEYTLTYEVTRTGGGKKQKVDTASLKLVDLQAKPIGKTITAFVDTKLPGLDQYSIKLSISNSNRSARYDYFARFANIKCEDPENYILLTSEGYPLIEKNFVFSEGTILQSKRCDAPIELYKISGGPEYPAPPHSHDNFASSNNYTRQLVSIVPEGEHQASFSNLTKGIYSLQTSPNSGIIFFHFNKWYPNCPDTAAFYEPLVYMCSPDEFSKFSSSENPRDEFEKFWLSCAGTKEAARKVIDEYYKRVLSANTEYTSTCEGWKTDRGMIYVIFGKPGYVERQMNREIWHYRSTINTTLTFTFNKIDNDYSDNDYRLERDLRYKPEWYNALGNWRKGRPFNLNGN